MKDQAKPKQCRVHPGQIADVLCRRCGAILCFDCFFDVAFLHCEPCTKIFLDTVQLPPRPVSFRSNLSAAAIALLVLIGVVLWISQQLQSVEKALFPAIVAGFITYQVLIQGARNYRAGFRKNKGRELFKADYMKLMDDFKGKLDGFDVSDMSSLFQLEFGELTLEEQLDLIREFCLAVERLDESEKKRSIPRPSKDA